MILYKRLFCFILNIFRILHTLLFYRRVLKPFSPFYCWRLSWLLLLSCQFFLGIDKDDSRKKKAGNSTIPAVTCDHTWDLNSIRDETYLNVEMLPLLISHLQLIQYYFIVQFAMCLWSILLAKIPNVLPWKWIPCR